MRKAQETAIRDFGKTMETRVIDENFESPPSVIIYVQFTKGETIIEYIVSPSGTTKPVASYICTMEQQDFFDQQPVLQQYLNR